MQPYGLINLMYSQFMMHGQKDIKLVKNVVFSDVTVC